MDEGIEIRRGTAADSRECHHLLFTTITDYEAAHGTPLDESEEEWWAGNEPIYDLLAAEAAEWWVATERASGTLIGFARSVENDGLFELTEFFVRTDHQARGLGRELLDRAFPLGRGKTRAIIATRDVRAQARYYAAGVAARFPIFGLTGRPSATDPTPGLTAHLVDGHADIATIRAIERSILGFERSDAVLKCILDNRETYLYRRDGAPVGYAFMSVDDSGPIGALDPADLPGILLHVEGRAHAVGMDELSLEVPAPNDVAVRHLLSRGFRIDPFMSFLMSDRPFGQFDRFIGFSPPLFL
jgi:GNAT superfamily N-acetyltransferase